MSNWTILGVLDWTREHFEARGIDTPRLDAEVLIAHALGIERVMLYARFDQPLSEEERATIRSLVLRRSKREPVAYITGEREFWSLPFAVTSDVLVPRPDSETIVELGTIALEGKDAPVVVDVGTGSGCLAVALAKERPDARIIALDVSAPACAVATKNASLNGVTIEVIESDLLAQLPDVRADLLVANLPYVRSDAFATLMPDVRDYEPRLALDGGADGLEPFRRLIPSLPTALKEGGTVLLEADPDQLPAISALLESSGLITVAVEQDLAGRDRVVRSCWGSPC